MANDDRLKAGGRVASVTNTDPRDVRAGEREATAPTYNREVTENRELSDDERRRRMREALHETLLPDLPVDPRYHRVWVSTTHNVDTVPRRTRLGYRVMTVEDVASSAWDPSSYAVADGQAKGALMWREMIAMQCPMDTYVDLMREQHHYAPLEAESGIYDRLEAAKAEMADRGGNIVLEEGFESLRKRVEMPHFA